MLLLKVKLWCWPGPLEDTRMFTLGCRKLLVTTDHKPLMSIMSNRQLSLIKNSRVVAFQEKTLMWDFNIIHVPGNKNVVPDVASRYPQHKPTKKSDVECSVSLMVARLVEQEFRAVTWEHLQEESKHDQECCAVIQRFVENILMKQSELSDECVTGGPTRISYTRWTM